MSGKNVTYYLECLYCGNKWEQKWVSGNPKCNSCGDKNIKVSQTKHEDVFGYDYTENKTTETVTLEEMLSLDTIRWGSD